MTSSDTAPIRLEALAYVVDGRTILDGIDLAVQAGEIVAVMGRSGSGKTTLLRLIMGLVPPTAGRVFVQGQEITRMGEAQLDHIRPQIGMVFQGAALFDSLTVAENVAFGLVEHRRLPAGRIPERVRELLDLVGMAAVEDLMPAQLSGGMRKRVGVARALALEPAIILYDEPTAGLDPISAAALDSLIVRLREEVGVTSVIVSHDVPSLRRVCDRAALLHDGRFLSVGPMAELVNSADEAVRQFLQGSPHGPLTEEAHPASGR
jgi:phospholipid/cholesterol/gamma-HCH transport system ATP-binding protein